MFPYTCSPPTPLSTISLIISILSWHDTFVNSWWTNIETLCINQSPKFTWWFSLCCTGLRVLWNPWYSVFTLRVSPKIAALSYNSPALCLCIPPSTNPKLWQSLIFFFFFSCLYGFFFSNMSYSWNHIVCSLFGLACFMHLSFLHVFAWFDSSFIFITE